jgi:hypothetical protein
MRAGLPKKEPEILKRWDEENLYKKLREQSASRPRYILHDGPPYANGHLHIGHALNKTLKDMVTRSKQMAGYDSNYVPGWDCHGLPIEWKVEEELRKKGKSKDDLDTVSLRRCAAPLPMNGSAFRPGVPPAGRRGRLRKLLHHHELRCRGDHRRRTDEVRHGRPALSRLQAGHVVGGRTHRPGRSRGGVSGL